MSKTAEEVLVPRTTKALLVMLAALFFYTAADLVTKEWALNNLSSERTGVQIPVCQPDEQGYLRMQRHATRAYPLVPGYLEFRYAENCGAAFGMLRTAPSWVRGAIFGLAGIGACIVLIVMFRRGVGGRLFAVSVPLVLSGAIGNLTDRVRHGFVVDFIRFHIKNSWEYPTFNVADISIAVGVGLLLLDGLRKPKATATLSSEASSPDAG